MKLYIMRCNFETTITAIAFSMSEALDYMAGEYGFHKDNTVTVHNIKCGLIPN